MSGVPYTPTPGIGAVDPALPDGPPANLALARELLDNRDFLGTVAQGTLEGDVRVVVGGDAAAPALGAGTVTATALCDADGRWWPGSAAAQVVLPGALAASTIHYLYLLVGTDGTVSYQVSTTAPVGSYRAVTLRRLRYVCAFATGLLGFPLPAVVHQRSGRYIASSGRAELTALDNGRATTWTTVDLAALVPPSATSAWVMARVKRAAADALPILQVRRAGDAGALDLMRVGTSTVGGVDVASEVSGLVCIPVSAQAFEYQLSAAVTASDPNGARFIVVGWE